MTAGVILLNIKAYPKSEKTACHVRIRKFQSQSSKFQVTVEILISRAENSITPLEISTYNNNTRVIYYFFLILIDFDKVPMTIKLSFGENNNLSNAVLLFITDEYQQMRY